MDATFQDDDAIQPLKIIHKCELISRGDVLEEKYNYLVYDFETEAHAYWARAYMDEPHRVSIFGPFAKGDASRRPIDAEIDQRVLAYLRRRFTDIFKLGPKGYESIE